VLEIRRMARKSSSRKAKSARRASAPARRLRTRKPDTVGTLVTAASHALALPIEASWHAGVTFNLQLLFKHAGLIDQYSLPNDIEPAPVFRA
jgi:Protein of unknown function (DUF4089)